MRKEKEVSLCFVYSQCSPNGNSPYCFHPIISHLHDCLATEKRRTSEEVFSGNIFCYNKCQIVVINVIANDFNVGKDDRLRMVDS